MVDIQDTEASNQESQISFIADRIIEAASKTSIACSDFNLVNIEAYQAEY